VEEAAEVLESHIVVSLTESCQHLILIGKYILFTYITYKFIYILKLNLNLKFISRNVKFLYTKKILPITVI